MQSPFKIFRKHQKVVLAGLTLMAMIGFGLGDVLQKMGGRSGGPQQVTKDVVETNVGGLSQIAMSNLVTHRTIVQRFIAAAFQTSHPEVARNQFLSQYYTRAIVGEFGFGGLTQRDLLYSWLHRYEARRMGIVVSDPQIKDYILRFTENKLSAKKFAAILDQMRLSPRELFDMFREELQGDIAQKMKVPAFLPSPEKYWEYYQQLNTLEKIEVAALPVNDFTDLIPEPTEKQIAGLFDKHKTEFERAFDAEYKPGFRQPRKVRLHYLALSSNAVEDKVLASGPVTEKEIEDYYERNKDKDRRFHEFEALPLDESAPIDPQFAPEKGPALDGDSEEMPDDSPAKPKDPSETRDDDPNSDAEKPQPKDEKKDNGDKDDEAPASKQGTDCLAIAEGDVAIDDDTDKPAAKKPAAKPEADDSPDTPESPDLPQPTDKPDTTETDDAGQEAPVVSGKKKPPEPPKIKYKPLDDSLKGQIRDSVINDRRKKLLKEQTNKAVVALKALGLKFATATKLTDPNPEELKTIERTSEEELRQIGDSLGMKFGKTDLLSEFELSEIPILGKAVELGTNDAPRGEPTTIVEQAFGNEALCRVFESEALDGTIYICWKVQDSPLHIPRLEDHGIREQVVKAWKRIEALPLAKKRAEELAERARQGKNDFGAALGGQTVTGDPKSLSVTVYESPEFSFYRESSAPDPVRRNPRSDVQIGNPIVVTSAGRKFMRTVFDDIAMGEIGVALNDDASIYYVVKVVSRRPADRDAFKEAKLFDPAAPYMQLAQIEMRYAMSAYTARLDEKYAVQWNDLPNRDVMNPMYDDE